MFLVRDLLFFFAHFKKNFQAQDTLPLSFILAERYANTPMFWHSCEVLSFDAFSFLSLFTNFKNLGFVSKSGRNRLQRVEEGKKKRRGRGKGDSKSIVAIEGLLSIWKRRYLVFVLFNLSSF